MHALPLRHGAIGCTVLNPDRPHLLGVGVRHGVAAAEAALAAAEATVAEIDLTPVAHPMATGIAR